MNDEVVRLNYTAHAVDDLTAFGNWIQKNGASEEKASLSLLGKAIKRLRSAEKFLLPHDCQLLSFSEVEDKYRDLIRLPFPSVALEFTTSPHKNGGAAKAIVLAWYAGSDLPPHALQSYDEIERNEVIAFTSFFYSERQRTWMPSPHIFWFHRDYLEMHMGGIRSGINCGLMYDGLHADMLSGLGDSQRQREEDGNLKVGMDALLEFTVTVNCENVEQSTLEPSKVLNQKRKSKFKEPFYSYKVLTIPGSGESDSLKGGSHSGPRLHLRRGHLRRLNSGKVTWVRHTIVGTPEQGVVEKTYQVQT